VVRLKNPAAAVEATECRRHKTCDVYDRSVTCSARYDPTDKPNKMYASRCYHQRRRCQVQRLRVNGGRSSRRDTSPESNARALARRHVYACIPDVVVARRSTARYTGTMPPVLQLDAAAEGASYSGIVCILGLGGGDDAYLPRRSPGFRIRLRRYSRR
jgi:hypothetical protein